MKRRRRQENNPLGTEALRFLAATFLQRKDKVFMLACNSLQIRQT
jgi:hypothetical protein